MSSRPLSFVSSRHSENALSIMKPSSPLNKPSTLDDITTTKTSPSQLNLCTYTVSSNLIKEFYDDVRCIYLTYFVSSHIHIQAGEDQGRLASLAKEFGLAKGRRQKRQIRKKHTFKVIFVLEIDRACMML